MDERFYNIFMYLYNKNILEYGQIVRNETESMIPDTEGCSNYVSMYVHFCNVSILNCTTALRIFLKQNSETYVIKFAISFLKSKMSDLHF